MFAAFEQPQRSRVVRQVKRLAQIGKESAEPWVHVTAAKIPAPVSRYEAQHRYQAVWRTCPVVLCSVKNCTNEIHR